MEEEVRGFTENDVVTKETFTMSVQKKGKWSEEDYTFTHDGVYSTSTGQQNVSNVSCTAFSKCRVIVYIYTLPGYLDIKKGRSRSFKRKFQ